MAETKSFTSAILITGEVGAKFQEGITGAAKKTNILGDALKKLQGTTVLTDRVVSSSRGLDAENAKLAAMEKQLAASQAALAATTAPTKTMQAETAKLAQTVERTRTALASHQANLEKMRVTLAKAGINTSQLSAEQTRLHGALDKLRGRTEFIDKVKEGFLKAGEAVKIMTEGVKHATEVMVGFTAAGFGLFELSKSVTEATANTISLAEGLNMTSTELQQIRYAAREAGIATSQTDSLLEHMVRTTHEARDGLSEQGKAFQRLGLDANSLSLYTPLEEVKQMTLALSKIHNARSRAEIGETVFGKDGGIRMVGLLSKGSDNLEQLLAKARAVGAARSEKENEDLAAKNVLLQDAAQRLEELKTQAGVAALPGVIKMMTLVTEFLDKNKEKIQKFFDDLATFAARAAPTLLKIASAALSIGSAILAVVSKAPGLFIAVSAFGTLVVHATLFAASIGKAGAMYKALWAGIKYAGEVFIATLQAFAVALDLPLIVIIAIGAAVVAAAFLVYKYWGPIKKFLASVWDESLAGLNRFWVQTKAFFEWVSKPGKAFADAINGNGFGVNPKVAALGKTVGLAGAIAASSLAPAQAAVPRGRWSNAQGAPISNHTTTIHIHPAQGMSEEALARKIVDIQKAEAAKAKRTQGHGGTLNHDD